MEHIKNDFMDDKEWESAQQNVDSKAGIFCPRCGNDRHTHLEHPDGDYLRCKCCGYFHSGIDLEEKIQSFGC